MPSIRIGPESLSIRRLDAQADVPMNGGVNVRGELLVGDVTDGLGESSTGRISSLIPRAVLRIMLVPLSSFIL